MYKGVNSSGDERVKLSIKEEGYHLLYIDETSKIAEHTKKGATVQFN